MLETHKTELAIAVFEAFGVLAATGALLAIFVVLAVGIGQTGSLATTAGGPAQLTGRTVGIVITGALHQASPRA
jgi:hypothetical protein